MFLNSQTRVFFLCLIQYFVFCRYTRLVEGEIHDCLTLLQKSEDGHYSRRHSSAKTVSCRGTPLPPHLYSQLVMHNEGVAMIYKYADVPKLLRVNISLS